jgi:crotonobetainyl-CoA:carnitine CoA-transferase CaiB-like acyl-CoA transferase
LTFAQRSARGAETQRAVGDAIAERCRDELVAALTAAEVPVAPVLDRKGMVASAPFPPFPIRLALPDVEAAAPALDQHRGEGFPAR